MIATIIFMVIGALALGLGLALIKSQVHLLSVVGYLT